MEEKKCQKCNGTMEEGIIFDKAGVGGQLLAEPEWGQLEKSWIMNKAKNKVKIKSFKCIACGYLESYAK